jgi:hypothetical protein
MALAITRSERVVRLAREGSAPVAIARSPTLAVERSERRLVAERTERRLSLQRDECGLSLTRTERTILLSRCGTPWAPAATEVEAAAAAETGLRSWSPLRVGQAVRATKLDDLATPDDNTDLNASTLRHGLLPKLSGIASQVLLATGAWAALSASDVGADPAGTAAGLLSSHLSTYDHSLLHNPLTISGNGLALVGQQLSLNIGTGATDVAAGNHAHSGVYLPVLGAASTDHAIVRWDGITGGVLQDSSFATLSDAGALSIAADTDTASILGRARLGYYGTADAVAFAHYDHFSETAAALRQVAAGTTYIGAASGQSIYLQIGGADFARYLVTGGNQNIWYYADDFTMYSANSAAGKPGYSIRGAGDGATGTTFSGGKSRGTIASPTKVLVSDNLFTFQAQGYVNGSYRTACQMIGIVGDTPADAATNVRGLWRFTCNDGTGTVARPLELRHTGAQLLDGTVSLPAMAWQSDTNTGLYRIGNDNPGMSCGAALITDWTTSGFRLAASKILYLNGATAAVNSDSTLFGYKDTGNITLALAAYGGAAGSGAAAGIRLIGARGTQASPAASQTHDTLGFVVGQGRGATATAVSGSAAFFMHAAENWTDAAQGSFIDLQTTPLGSTTREVSARLQAGVGLTLADTYLGPYAMIGSTSSAALTNSDHVARSIGRQGQYSAIQIYDAIYNGGMDCYDAVSGVLEIKTGSTVLHASAVGGYVDLDEDDTNGVCLFGAGLLRGDDQHLWGLNTVLMDNATYTGHSGTGRILANELDFNVCGTATQVMGLSLGGNSLAQPTTANGFLVNSLGSNIKWTTGFWSMDGCATNAFVAGATAASGTDVDSQPMQWHYFDGSSNKKIVQMYADAYSGTAYLTLSCTGNLAFKILAGDIFLDTGQGLRVNNNVVVSDRVINADLANTPDSGDTDTDDLIAAIVSVLTTHGLGAAA